MPFPGIQRALRIRDSTQSTQSYEREFAENMTLSSANSLFHSANSAFMLFRD
jgi:hypothetical protein